jgi:hypothetical protein
MSSVGSAEAAQWDEEGWCLLECFLPEDAVKAAQAALPALFPTAEEFANDVDPERNQPFRVDSHSVMPRFPFDASALNDLVLHDSLLDLAEQFLGTSNFRLYQGMLSAKYGHGAPDDEQFLHVDYGNHTLVVPRHEVGFQQLELFLYLSDVTPELAATRMVSRSLTGEIATERAYLSPQEYPHLYGAEVPASGPAGSVLVYRPDVYHRGVRMEAAGGVRFMLHVSFKPADTDWLGSHALPSEAEGVAWHRFMQRTNLRQLTALGFPPPGHAYWNEATLLGVAARYPFLDLSPWRDAWTASA